MTGFNSKRDAAADKLQEPVREALKLALEVMQINLTLLEKVDPYEDQEDLLSDSLDLTHKAITAIKEALAQPAQKPDYTVALDEWLDKTEWVQEKINSGHLGARYLGMHRADVLRYLAYPNTVTGKAPAQPAQEPDAYQSGFYDGEKAARARCIELVLAGSSMPIQTRTLEALQRDRKRIAALIEEDGKS